MPIRRRLLFGSSLLVLIALLASAWYMWTKGFTRSWRALIAREFEKQGIELSLRRLTLDPLRGLVAQEVKLLDARDRRRVLAVVDEMLLGVNYAAALKREPFLEFVDLREAHLSLPLDATKADGPTVEISKLNARLFLPPHQLYLARAEAEVLGVQVYMTGRLINPQEFAGDGVRDPLLRSGLAQVLEQIAALKFRGAPPVLSLEFKGDLQRPEEITLGARFYAEGLRRKNYTASQIFAAASYRAGVLELQQIGLKDGKGELRGSATYHLGSKRMTARVQSGIAMHELIRAYASLPWPEQLVVNSAPKLDLTLEGELGHTRDWSVYGHIALERLSWRGVLFRGLTTDVSWSGGRWSLRDFHLRHASGNLVGDAMAVPGDFRARVHGSMNPQAFAPLLDATSKAWLARFEFLESPTLQMEVHGSAPDWESCRGSGQLQFKRGLYEGHATDSYSAALRLEEGALSLAPFHTGGGEEGELVFDLRKKEVRLEKKQTGAAAPAGSHGRS